MKKILFLLPLACLMLFGCSSSKITKTADKADEMISAIEETTSKFKTLVAKDANGYSYEYVTNDPTKTRIYTLDNGLKVYLSVYDGAPKVQTFIPVKAGGKFDPANSTGLAHYLEHMMFKGTHDYGTKDWAAEKVYLDSIENMFEHYRTLTDADERKDLYKKIDEVSNEASKFAIANEYDKLVQYCGATGTNAYTTEDRTVYVNNIPANQVENWLKIEGNRFGTIVNRLFHTELEAVYEEKNRSLDNDGWKVYENMYKLMFKNHKYGLQTVIGTIDHLKNPSIKDINEYFYTYYVPNNYAICLAGDLNPEETIKLVEKYFGQHKPKTVPTYTPAKEMPITAPRDHTVYGPDAERITMAFRFGGLASEDYPKVQMVDMILNNSMAGLIDLNLVQGQKVLGAGCYVDAMNDFALHTFYGNPRDGQPLEEVRDLILEQIEKVKTGDFEDWLLPAIVNDFKKSELQSLENNQARANMMVMAFTNDIPWEEYCKRIERLKDITKAEIVAFANKHYGNNYGIVYKRSGEEPNKQQVEKPSITKVDLDRKTRSQFFQDIIANDVPSLTPAFLDYEKDLGKLAMKSNIPVLYKENQENELFTLYYLLETGTNENPRLKYAIDYLEYLGTNNYSSDELKKEFYKLGCNINVSSSNERVYVYLSGLQENMESAIQLFEELLANPVADEAVLQNMISDAHKQRSNAKQNKGAILWSGLQNYAKYGEDSPFTNVLSNEELDALDANALVDLIKSVPKTEHKVMYYGPASSDDLLVMLNKYHNVPDALMPAPERRKFKEVSSENPSVYWANYDMVQAEILFQHKGDEYNKDIAPQARMFNEYFGGMSGIAFQEIREAQGLAYSVFTGYRQSNKKDGSDILMAYVGTQADKQEEAMKAMVNLLNDMPESEQTFENAKKGILESIESARINKTSVFFNYLDAQQKGLDYDIRKDIYTKVKAMTFQDLKAFHADYVKGKRFNIGLIGNKEKLDFEALKKYGTVKELKLDALFGYKTIIKP